MCSVRTALQNERCGTLVWTFVGLMFDRDCSRDSTITEGAGARPYSFLARLTSTSLHLGVNVRSFWLTPPCPPL